MPSFIAIGIPSTLSLGVLLGIDYGVAEGLASTPFLFTLVFILFTLYYYL